MKQFAWAATDPTALALPTGGTAQPQGGGTGAEWPKVTRERKQTTQQAQSVTNFTHSILGTATAEPRDKNGKGETKLLTEKRREPRSDHPKDNGRREEKDLPPV